jgi:mono/diheme cytochrome c family protein
MKDTLSMSMLTMGMLTMRAGALSVIAIGAGTFGQEPSAVEQPATLAEVAESEILFVRRVAPILREKCVACHGLEPNMLEGGLDLTGPAATQTSGDSGDLPIIPGKPATSPLYLAISRNSQLWSPMPPKEAEALTAEQLGFIQQWIESGASWPDAERQLQIASLFDDAWSAEDGVLVATSGGLSDAWTRRRYAPQGLWGYQPVVTRAVVTRAADTRAADTRAADTRAADTPSLASQPADRSGQHPIDALIERQLPAGLTAAPRADRRTLIRRATFDLTGLPPAPDAVQRFIDDPRSDQEAFAQVIERLLHSPHYGERMAQHWLDVVRYADSSGFANDYERGNAWRYRDYVIRAFNADKPYDQFIREQIAGDELDPTDPQLLVAAGFLRMGPWELTGMEVPKIARQRFLDDVTNSVGETFLAQALQCARCHDHKFDPVPTRDYYAIQAVFATTQLAERATPFLAEEILHGFEEQRYLQLAAEAHRRTLEELDIVLLRNAEQWFTAQGLDPTAWQAALTKTGESGGARNNRFNAARSELQKQGVPEQQYPPKLVGFTPEQFGLERVARKGLERLRWELERYEPFALSVYSGTTLKLNAVYAPQRMPDNPASDGQTENTCILVGGDPFATGDPVPPGVLSALSGQLPAALPDTLAGRRTALADWIAHRDNPLTTRAIVNRLWLWHFGQGLAGNPNNFGASGKPPTHPELLDWLAAELVASNWSIKSLHRTIMTSEAYCRSAAHPDHAVLRTLDPNTTSYAVFLPRRLTAEELRDSLLFASGELNPALGGIPVRPEINLEAALQPRQVMGTFAAAWTPNPLPDQRHRRSIYTLKLRGLVDPLLEVFNAPSADLSCEQREASTVTPQVFTLFNGHNTHARALALAHRVIQAGLDDESTIRACFELAYARAPTPAELQLCLAHWRTTTQELEEVQRPAFSLPTEIVREAIEENTGERFSFTEQLYANREFVPDLQPWQVDRRTRSLAALCLVLFNSNEFVYLY